MNPTSPARRRKTSPRLPAPCTRSPTRCSRSASPTSARARTSAPAGITRPAARLPRTTAPQALSRARHHHHHRPAGGRLSIPGQPRTLIPAAPEPPPNRHPGPPAGQPAQASSPRNRSGQGSLPHAHCPVPDNSARYGGFDLGGPVRLAMGLAPNLPVNVAITELSPGDVINSGPGRRTAAVVAADGGAVVADGGVAHLGVVLVEQALPDLHWREPGFGEEPGADQRPY